jgi:hypothetical protein
MAWIERSVWIVVVVLLTVMLFWVRADMQELSTWVNMQNEQLEEIDALLDIAESRAQSIGENRGSASILPDYEIRILKGKGLEDPVNDLKADLMANSNLIPYDPVLGGSMSFYSANDITILPGGWVYAIFEDGHVNGALLLEYQVTEGIVNWNVFKHQLF